MIERQVQAMRFWFRNDGEFQNCRLWIGWFQIYFKLNIVIYTVYVKFKPCSVQHVSNERVILILQCLSMYHYSFKNTCARYFGICTWEASEYLKTLWSCFEEPLIPLRWDREFNRLIYYSSFKSSAGSKPKPNGTERAGTNQNDSDRIDRNICIRVEKMNQNNE